MILAEGFIPGKPRPKGSLKPRVGRGPGGKLKITLHDDPASEAWKLTMTRWIKDHVGEFDAYGFSGPVNVAAKFYFVKTVGVSGEVWPSHDTPVPMADDIGDTDKLQRNLGDALEQSGLITNDRNIIKWIDPEKFWVPGQFFLADAKPGVWFQVIAR